MNNLSFCRMFGKNMGLKSLTITIAYPFSPDDMVLLKYPSWISFCRNHLRSKYDHDLNYKETYTCHAILRKIVKEEIFQIDNTRSLNRLISAETSQRASSRVMIGNRSKPQLTALCERYVKCIWGELIDRQTSLPNEISASHWKSTVEWLRVASQHNF